jgi:AraC-like DNA-binding protein
MHPGLFDGGEAMLWRSAGVRWRQLFGDFSRLGVSFEWHELRADQEVDWAPSFHPDSVELCLNLSGAGEVRLGDTSLHLQSGTAGFYRQGRETFDARRVSGQAHHFITVEFSRPFLSGHLSGCRSALHPVVRDSLDHGVDRSALGAVEPLGPRHRDLVASLHQPPVLAAAQGVWYQAKAVELMGEFFFQPPADEELFCHRQQKVARSRVEMVMTLLKRDLTRPPTLEQLGKEVGCSPFYLSRTFSKETGATIPQFIRRLRLEWAGDLLREGRLNVTEVALEVGYSSLSHFSHAFHQQFGCCPGLYPTATATQRASLRPGEERDRRRGG